MKNQTEFLSTSELAQVLKVQGTSIRRGLCVNGHYLGMKPNKLPNGRLLWPEAPVRALIGENSAECAR